MKILYVVNEAGFFLSHRLPLGQEARQRGHDVVVATAPDTGEQQLAQFGFRHVPVPLSRSGFQPFREIATYRALKRVYREEQPDLVHQITIKPVIYGSFAARAVGLGAVVNAVPGMGFVFTRRGLLAGIVRRVVNQLYRLAFSGLHMRVIFQNSEDLGAFLDVGIVRRGQTVLIRGSGVDLDEFSPGPEPASPTVFVLVARMLRDKGLVELARAAKLVRRSHPQWRFLMAGGVDPGNPASMIEAQLRRLEEECGVEWLGHVGDVAQLLRNCHVACLPSYREGVPKSLLEASAAGLPMIASDIAGCREVVTGEVNGLLVPPRQVEPLAAAMLRMGEDHEFRRRCGRAARARAEAVFSVKDVVEHTFRVYDELLAT